MMEAKAFIRAITRLRSDIQYLKRSSAMRGSIRRIQDMERLAKRSHIQGNRRVTSTEHGSVSTSTWPVGRGRQGREQEKLFNAACKNMSEE